MDARAYVEWTWRVPWLAEAGAKLNARTTAAAAAAGGAGRRWTSGLRRGKTALELAVDHGHAEVVRLLEEAAAAGGGGKRASKRNGGGGGGGSGGRFGVSGRTLVMLVVLALLLAVAGLAVVGGVYGMRTELKEWRELRARRAARKATKASARAGDRLASRRRVAFGLFTPPPHDGKFMSVQT